SSTFWPPPPSPSAGPPSPRSPPSWPPRRPTPASCPPASPGPAGSWRRSAPARSTSPWRRSSPGGCCEAAAVLTSWVPGAARSGFPAEHLPYGVFSVGSGDRRVGVRIGDSVLDLARLAETVDDLDRHAAGTFARP